MVLSLAFILAFIGSAVALLIGILIFSEVAEAMSATLPEILVEIPTTPEVDGLWFMREHCINVNCTNINPANEYRFSMTSTTTDGFDGVVTMGGGGGNSAIATGGYMFKVFDKAEIDGKLITWEYSRDRLNGATADVQLFDGALDGNKFGHTPLNCGIDCFPDQAGIVTSGSGSRIEVVTGLAGLSDFTVKNNTGSANLSSYNSPTGKVTVAIFQPENSPAVGIGTNSFQITIEDIGTYRWKSDPANSWSGSVITCLVDSDNCRTNVNGVTPEAREGYWSVTSFPPPPLPVFNSEQTLNANKTFNNALNIGFTVVGILPVALFFALFAIFSGRTGAE